MKKLRKPLAGLVILLLSLSLVAITGCDNGSGSGGFTDGRTPVADGVYFVESWGYSHRVPITVRTTIARNSIIDISVVGNNGENRLLMEAIRDRLIPRIIQSQSIGVDVIASATHSSVGVIEGVAQAIEKAGGKADEWDTGPILRNGLVQLHDYDVIVVGLGGAGMAAYASAAETSGVSVFGMEVGGKVGGNTTLAGGPLAVNSRYLAQRQAGGAIDLPYTDRDALLQQWWSDMQSVVPPVSEMGDRHWYPYASGAGGTNNGVTTLIPENGDFARTSFIPPRHNTGFNMTASTENIGGTSYKLPQINWSLPNVPSSPAGAVGASGGFRESQGYTPPQRTMSPVYSETNIRNGDAQDRGGGAKWDVVRYLVDRSGAAVDWMASGSPFGGMGLNFLGAGTLSYGQFVIVGTQANDSANTSGQYSNDDGPNIHKTLAFHRVLTNAKAKHPRSDFMLELRAIELITVPNAANPGGVEIVGVRARRWDGTIYEVFGRTVILATGGFIGNQEMTSRYLGYPSRYKAVATDRGDGINLAKSVGAGTYNIDMAAMVHCSNVRNKVYPRIRPTVAEDEMWKATLEGLLYKRDNIVIGLNHGPGTMDLRGRRFINENPPMFGDDGHDFGNWRAGGFFGALFSRDVIDHITVNGATALTAAATISFPATGNYQYMQSVPDQASGNYMPAANTPLPFLPQLLDVMEGYGNVLQADTLYNLAGKILGLGHPGVIENITQTQLAERMRETILLYNTLYPTNPDGTARTPAPDVVQPNSGGGLVDGAPAPWVKSSVAANFTYPQVNPGLNINDPIGYAIIMGNGYAYGTSGSLDVDVKTRVLHYSSTATNPVPIPGLYAVGQDSHGVLYSRQNPYAAYGAVAIGWAFTSGRRAGIEAAELAESIKARR